MPMMNGIELAKEIRKSTKKYIPIIASTGNNDKDSLQQIKDAGIDDFIGKPFFKEEFLETLSRWLSSNTNS